MRLREGLEGRGCRGVSGVWHKAAAAGPQGGQAQPWDMGPQAAHTPALRQWMWVNYTRAWPQRLLLLLLLWPYVPQRLSGG